MKSQANGIPFLPLMTLGIAAILFGTFVFVAVMAWTPGPSDAAEIPVDPDKPAMLLAGQIGMEPKPAPARTEEEARKGMHARARTRAKVWAACPECGFVASTREFEHWSEESKSGVVGEEAERPIRRHIVTIRMKDGTSRAFVDAHPANWRPGERVIFIEGDNRPND